MASSYPLSTGDGTAPFMEEMLAALVDRGHTVSIVVPRIKGLVEGNRRGVEVRGAPYAPARGQVWGYGRSLGPRGQLRPLAILVSPVVLVSLARLLRHEIRLRRPDIVHLHWILPQGVLALAIPQEIPLVISAHGADARFATGGMRKVASIPLSRASLVIAASSEILDALAAHHPGVSAKRQTIPHGADKSMGNYDRTVARRELGLDLDAPLVLAVGRLVEKKGFRNLLQAAPLLPSSVTVAIAGDGPGSQTLKALGRRTGSTVRFLGQVNRRDLSKWYAACDLVCIPSVPAGQDIDSGPVVLVESMAAGRGVIATRVGMAPDLVVNGYNGYLLDDSDPGRLAHAIQVGLNQAEALGRGAAKTFADLGSWDRVAVELENAYRMVLIGDDR